MLLEELITLQVHIAKIRKERKAKNEKRFYYVVEKARVEMKKCRAKRNKWENRSQYKIIVKVRVKERNEVPYSGKFLPGKNFQQHSAKFLSDSFLHTPKLLPGRISTLCKCCINALRRWQATNMERQCWARGYHVLYQCVWRFHWWKAWLRVMAVFACSNIVEGSHAERGPAESGSSVFAMTKPSCCAAGPCSTTLTEHMFIVYRK